jgi:hypothetical protein
MADADGHRCEHEPVGARVAGGHLVVVMACHVVVPHLMIHSGAIPHIMCPVFCVTLVVTIDRASLSLLGLLGRPYFTYVHTARGAR